MVAERYESHSRHVGFRVLAIVLLLFMVITLLAVSSPTFADDIAEEAVSTSSSSVEELLPPEGESPAPEDSETTSDASVDESADPTDGNEEEPPLATEPANEPSEASLQSDEVPIATQPEEEPAPPAKSASTSSAREEEEAELSLAADEGAYTGGTIPILRFTFLDGVDPDTGEPLTGDEKIDLVNNSPNHVYRATGVVCDLEVPSTYDNPESDMPDGVSGYKGASNLSVEYFRGRGNSSWRNAKKPYKFKLDDKANLFGMGKNKHWVLIANDFDKSLSIDRIIGWVGEQMGLPYTPRGVPVDLFMNGKYYGSYLLMEEVRIDDNRVDIAEVPENASDPDSSEITGGYLIGVSRKPTATEDEVFETSRGTRFSYDTPEYEPPLTDAQKAQQAYLKSYLDRVEEAVYGDGFVNGDGESVWDLMDRESLANYWWIQEFSCNRDAFATPSTYLYKVRDDKLYWGPLWDFDYVWGGMEVEGFDNTNTYDMRWIERLRSDADFVALLKERWKDLDGALDDLTKEGGLIDQYIEEMDTSWAANDDRWNVGGTDELGWRDGSCAEALNELRERIEARRTWINGHLDELQTVFRTLSFVDGDEVVYNEESRPDRGINPDPPAAPAKDGLIFDGWLADDGEEYDVETRYYEDTVFRATYVDPASVTAATGIYFATPEVWISYPRNLRYDLVPTDAKDTRIIWSSSDESVVTVDANGRVSPVEGCLDGRETAEAIVTAHLVGSGKETSVRVVVYDSGTTTLPQPESITFDEKLTVEVGEYRQLEFTSEPVPNALYESFDLTFHAEDEDIASVTSTGVVLGKSPGTTTILVQRYDQDTWEVQTIATIALTVTEGESGEDDSTFSIVYKLNGGSIGGNTDDVRVQCKPGDVISILEAPERDGYTFRYWKGSRYQPGDKYTVSGDHTFTAVWKQDAKKSEGAHGASSSKKASSSTTKGKTTHHASSRMSRTPRTGDETDLAFLVIALCVTALVFAGARSMRSRS